MGPKAVVCRHWYATQEACLGYVPQPGDCRTAWTRYTAVPAWYWQFWIRPRLDQDHPPPNPKIDSSVPPPAPTQHSTGVTAVQSSSLFTEPTETMGHALLLKILLLCTHLAVVKPSDQLALLVHAWKVEHN